MKYGIIYKITNKVNGKIYIGKTVQPFKQRVKSHKYKSCRAFNNAIKTYGWDSFEKEEFICSLDEKHLASLEEQTIKFYNCLAPNGYNLIQIDKGLNRYPDEVRNRISESRYKYLKTLEEPIIPKNRKQTIEIDGIKYRPCNLCKINLPLTAYAKAPSRWDGHAVICKKCHQDKYNSKQDRRTLTEEQFKASYQGRQDPDKQRKPYLDNPEFKLRSSKASSKPIIATHIETGETLEFPSALKAKESGFSNSNIGVAIKNQTPYKKYKWRFK
jgi:GIY-YIG catalytic domain-containing protein